VAEITALRSELQRLSTPSTVDPRALDDWQPAFTLGTTQILGPGSAAFADTGEERARTPHIDTSFVGQLGLDTSLFAHADDDLDDDVVLFNTYPDEAPSSNVAPGGVLTRVTDGDPPQSRGGTTDDLEAIIQAAILEQVEESRALTEQQKINSLQVRHQSYASKGPTS
jgi:hypothetical protein